MAILLRLSALVAILWAGLLLAAPGQLSEGEPTATNTTLAQLLAVHYVALAGLFVWASRTPHRHLPVIIIAISTTAARIVIDLAGLLGELPADPAVYFVVDLLVGTALLVGLLEALPRTMAARRDTATHSGGES